MPNGELACKHCGSGVFRREGASVETWLVSLREEGEGLAEDELELEPYDVEGYVEPPRYTCHGCGRRLDLWTDLVARFEFSGGARSS